MKKSIIMTLCAAALALTGCHKHKPTPVQADTYDFDAVLASDKALVEKQNPDFTIKFYEAQGMLATNLNETVGQPKVVAIKTVWARLQNDKPPKTTIVTHAEGAFGAEPTVENLDGLWVEDQIVDIDHKVSAEAAAQRILETNIPKVPTSRTFVLRQPVWKTNPTEKYYIFGSIGGGALVQVNSVTGEVKECEF